MLLDTVSERLVPGVSERLAAKLDLAQQALPRLHTPFFLFDAREVDYSLSLFSRHLPQTRIFYAVKANDDSMLLRHLRDRACSFDVASVGELRRMRALGVAADRMVFANPVKSTEAIEEAFRAGIRAYTLDSDDEARKLALVTGRMGLAPQDQPVGLVRIRTRSVGVTSDLSLKFGCAVEEAAGLMARSRALGLRIEGVAFHVGTQSYRSENYVRALGDCRQIQAQLAQMNEVPLRIIDIGGGFPCDTQGGGGVVALEDLFRAIGQAMQHPALASIEFWAEPGRSVAGPSSTLVVRVVGRRDVDGVRLLYLDDGVYGGLSAAINDHAKFRFLPLQHAEGPLVPFTLFGPTCDSFDRIDDGVMLPASMAEGDVLVVPDVGAYSRVTAAPFNGFPVPSRFVARPGRRRRLPEVVLTPPPVVYTASLRDA